MKHQNTRAESAATIFPVTLFDLLLFSGSFIGSAQANPASSPCKSTVTGDLDIVPLKSAVYANTRNLRVWLPPGYTAIEKLLSVEEIQDSVSLREVGWVMITSTLEGKRIPEFLAHDVLPFVASHYRVTKDREHTGVGGYSLGCVAALTALLDRPDLFGLGLLESTSLHLGNGRLIRETAPILEGPVRISIGVGTAEVDPKVSKQIGVPDFRHSLRAAQSNSGG